MNIRNIRKIKQNLQILQNQNDFQESQVLGLIHDNDSSPATLWSSL